MNNLVETGKCFLMSKLSLVTGRGVQYSRSSKRSAENTEWMKQEQEDFCTADLKGVASSPVRRIVYITVLTSSNLIQITSQFLLLIHPVKTSVNIISNWNAISVSLNTELVVIFMHT